MAPPLGSLPSPARLADLLGAPVVAVDVEHVGTFSNEVWRLHLRYDGAAPGAPASLIAKHPAAGRPDRSSEDFANEIRFYRELAARAPARLPRFYDTGDADLLLLLEDVQGLQAFRWNASETHARIALESLARVHAAFWDAVDDLDWVPQMADPARRAVFADDYDRGWSERRDYFATIGLGAFLATGDALVGRVADTLVALAEPATLLHGDPHGENLPLVSGDAGEDVVLLDWPSLRRGRACFDVAVFVAMSVPVPVRRRRERDWVALHAEALAAAGVRDGGDPWQAYRLGILRRAIRIVEIAPGWPAAGEGGLRMVAERCLMAAADLDTAELIA